MRKEEQEKTKVLLINAISLAHASYKNYVTRKAFYHQMFVKKEELSLQVVKQCKVKCPDELSKIVVNLDVNYDLPLKYGTQAKPDYEDKMHLYRLRLVVTLVTSAANNARQKVMKTCQM
ncbi:hypothetical protein CK203_042573 [Vitis vinifera]|uniref:Uncharacterized protein n=1 Tax=Vitis vinifera TaxID=29760 RepID=A0A438I7Q7_VITVI|nr:hypothetical protein CK203_042573 [Vitis vinifera]